MTLTIDLPPDVMTRLQQEAERYGLAITELAGSLIDRSERNGDVTPVC